ncbi:hypothetical protein AVEN_11839-1 [Araneus ventricosus]|uniref:Uncharacterized protein n=1 Tax=Araneus ventricosus TaxID=182803 RepID=A0A4Y2K8X1_ARAVE|nr:hypothetical protein AVEN_11839-1 [Araneus ventricosus]
MSDLTCTRPTYTAHLQWNRVSSLKPSGSEAENLPVGHRGSEILKNRHVFDFNEAKTYNIELGKMDIDDQTQSGMRVSGMKFRVIVTTVRRKSSRRDCESCEIGISIEF